MQHVNNEVENDEAVSNEERESDYWQTLIA